MILIKPLGDRLHGHLRSHMRVPAQNEAQTSIRVAQAQYSGYSVPAVKNRLLNQSSGMVAIVIVLPNLCFLTNPEQIAVRQSASSLKPGAASELHTASASRIARRSQTALTQGRMIRRADLDTGCCPSPFANVGVGASSGIDPDIAFPSTWPCTRLILPTAIGPRVNGAAGDRSGQSVCGHCHCSKQHHDEGRNGHRHAAIGHNRECQPHFDPSSRSDTVALAWEATAIPTEGQDPAGHRALRTTASNVSNQCDVSNGCDEVPGGDCKGPDDARYHPRNATRVPANLSRGGVPIDP